MDNRKFCLPLIKEPPAKLLFEKEVTSLEFTEIICGMDANVNINRSKRDIYLMKHGKKLFKTHPLKKKNKIRLFFRNLYERKIDHNMDYANFERILRELNTEVYVPSQEEIDAMLTPVKNDDKLKDACNIPEVRSMEETLESNVSQLLTDVAETINSFEAEWQKTGEKYNLFNIADIARDERIMCRVLTDLLNPKGKHCQGNRYLDLFWKAISPKLSEGLLKLYHFHKNTEVTTNYPIKVTTEDGTDKKEDGTDKNRFIDIALWDGRIFVPIEVKIGARDQPKQVADYYKFAKEINKDVHVPLLYLTLDGHEPSDLSKDDIGKDAYVKLTFRDDILAWLEACAEKTPKTTVPVWESLRQLTAAINSLYGKSEDTKMEDAILKLVTGNDDTIRAALEIRRLADFHVRVLNTFTDALAIVKEKFPNAKPPQKDKDNENEKKNSYYMEIPIKEGNYLLQVNYDWTAVWLKAESCKVDSTSKKEWENLRKKMKEFFKSEGDLPPQERSVWSFEDLSWPLPLLEDYAKNNKRDLYLAHLSKLSSQEVADRIIDIASAIAKELEDVKV